MLSYWEQASFLDHDYLIVGGGLIGLSTAVEIAERDPGRRILVLEKGLLPTGASTKNAGFACFGSLTEVISDIQRMGQDAALALLERRFRGLHLLRQRLGDQAIGYEHYGGFELLFEPQVHALHELPHMNAILRSIFKAEVFQRVKDKTESWGFNARTVRAIIKNPFEGQLHSGKLMRALMHRAMDHGIEIRTGAEVVGFEETADGVEVRAKGVHQGETIAYRARRAAVCTNGHSLNLIPELDIQPARGQVLVTEPIPGLAWRGCFHADEGYIYFRNITDPRGDRILLGGARNLAFEAEATTALEITQTIQGRLEALLRDVILPGKPVKVEHRWAGLMGFSPDKQPIVRRLSPNVVVGFGCNGMGVALGSLIAQEAAGLILED